MFALPEFGGISSNEYRPASLLDEQVFVICSTVIRIKCLDGMYYRHTANQTLLSFEGREVGRDAVAKMLRLLLGNLLF